MRCKAPDIDLYDLAEAVAILVRSHERRDPAQHRDDRHRAAIALVQAVVEAACAAGYETSSERGGYVIAHRGKGAVYLGVRESSAEPFVLPVDGGLPCTLPIQYDAAVGVFVSEKEDSFYEHVPGSPKRHQSAVAAVAECISEMLDRVPKTRLR